MNYNSDRTRARILDAALAEFREHGYERAGLRRIAAAARVTTGAVYNHFGSKEGLFDALVGESAAELVDAWTAGRDDGAPAPRTTGAVAATAAPADPKMPASMSATPRPTTSRLMPVCVKQRATSGPQRSDIYAVVSPGTAREVHKMSASRRVRTMTRPVHPKARPSP